MQEALSTLYNWLAISDEPQRADLIFLFGAPTLAVPEYLAFQQHERTPQQLESEKAKRQTTYEVNEAEKQRSDEALSPCNKACQQDTP